MNWRGGGGVGFLSSLLAASVHGSVTAGRRIPLQSRKDIAVIEPFSRNIVPAQPSQITVAQHSSCWLESWFIDWLIDLLSINTFLAPLSDLQRRADFFSANLLRSLIFIFLVYSMLRFPAFDEEGWARTTDSFEFVLHWRTETVL